MSNFGDKRGLLKADMERAQQRRVAKTLKRDADGRIIRPTLNPRHLEVVDEFFDNGYNKKRAMLAVGYSEKMAAKNPGHVFNRADVIAEIEWRKEQLARRWEATQERIIEELSTVAFANFGALLSIQPDGTAYVDLNELDDRTRGAVAEFTTDEYIEGRGEDGRTVKKYKIKMHDKMRALDMLMRHLGMYKDTVTVKGELSVVERLQAGRARLRQAQIIEGEAEEVDDAA